MNILMRNLISSILCVLVSTVALSQIKTKKYIRRNKDATTLFYGDSTIYSRGIYNDSTRLFVGNSNGAIYYINLEKNKVQLIFKLPDFDELRDIEKSGDHLIGMHSGADGKIVILKMDGSMKIVQYPEWKGVFLDGVDFIGTRGFMMGDPVDGKFSLFHSNDEGLTWSRCIGEIEAFEGEAAFAASGSTVHIMNDSTYVFVTGGLKSRFFKSTNNGDSWSEVVLPYYPGESIGPYSMCFADDKSGVMVGGDYLDPAIRMNTCFYTTDGGASWINAENSVRGYRSCVFFTKNVYYACGSNGIDFSLNGGIDWIPFSDGSFFSLTATNDKLIATTRYGTIAMFDLIEVEE